MLRDTFLFSRWNISPFFLEAVVEGADIREKLPEVKDIQRIVCLSPGPPGSNGQDIVFGKGFKDVFVDQQCFSVYVSFFMKHFCRNAIGGLEQVLAEIDLLKNLFDNISAPTSPV